jgi:4-amino-4-deoxy-L-arabinose transferase-like glycosyltransferase
VCTGLLTWVRQNLRAPWKVAVLVGALAFIVRAGFALTLEERWYFYDTVHYDAAARSLLRGEGFRYERPFFGTTAYSLEPLYPLFLAGNYALFGRWFSAVRIVQALLGALTCVVAFFLSAQLFDRKVAALAGAVCAIYPPLIFISNLLYPEQLFTLLLAGSMWYVVKYSRSAKTGYVLGMAVLLGLAALAKGIALSLLPVLALWMLLFAPVGAKHRLQHLALLVVVTALVLLPWSLRNYRVFGKIAPVRAHATMVLDDRFAQKDEPLLSQWLHGKVNTGRFALRYLHEFAHFWTPSLGRLQSRNEFTTRWANVVSVLAAGPVLFLALVGVWCCRKRLRDVLPLLLVVLTFACSYSFFLTHVRYRLPVEPYLIILASVGWWCAWARLGPRGRRTYAAPFSAGG